MKVFVIIATKKMHKRFTFRCVFQNTMCKYYQLKKPICYTPYTKYINGI